MLFSQVSKDFPRVVRFHVSRQDGIMYFFCTYVVEPFPNLVQNLFLILFRKREKLIGNTFGYGCHDRTLYSLLLGVTTL